MMTITKMRDELENSLTPRTYWMRDAILREAEHLVARYAVARNYENYVNVLLDSDYQLKIALENLETALQNLK